MGENVLKEGSGTSSGKKWTAHSRSRVNHTTCRKSIITPRLNFELFLFHLYITYFFFFSGTFIYFLASYSHTWQIDVFKKGKATVAKKKEGKNRFLSNILFCFLSSYNLRGDDYSLIFFEVLLLFIDKKSRNRKQQKRSRKRAYLPQLYIDSTYYYLLLHSRLHITAVQIQQFVSIRILVTPLKQQHQ